MASDDISLVLGAAMADPSWRTVLWLSVLGVVSGVLGGLAGLGGSGFIIPGLAIIIGYHAEGSPEHHLFMAAAMGCNVLVSIPATWRHSRNGLIDASLFRRVLPGQVLGVVAGVFASNVFRGETLRVVLAILIVVTVLASLLRDAGESRRKAENRKPKKASALALSSTSACTGVVSGLAGLGGGALLVPALRAVGGVPLRQAIAVSSAMICLSSSFGALVKMSTLASHGQNWVDAIKLVGLIGPGAMVGSVVGAELAARIHTRVLAFIISGLLLTVAARMAGFI